MSERVPAQNKTSATPSQATQASSPPLHRRSLTDEQSKSVGSSSNISQELGGIQPKTIRRSLNWQNISVEAPSRGNGMSLPGGIQRQQEEQEGTPAIEPQVSAKKAETSMGELSNLTRATEGRSVQPKSDRGRLNWRNISVEAPARNGETSSQPIQRQQEEHQEEAPEIQAQLAADSAQKSALESSNSTISTSEPAQKPLIARTPFNGRNIPVEAPQRSSASSAYQGIQRLETSGVKEQEKSTESLQMQSEEEIQAKSSSGEPQEKEEQNQKLVQAKLTVGAPGDKYEQEADSMAAKVMTMPDSVIQQPIQRQAGEDTEAVQMQPEVNSISPLVQRESGKEEEVQMKSGAKRASDGSSVASSSIESRLASSKGGESLLGKGNSGNNGGKPDERTKEEKQADLDKAMTEAQAYLDGFSGKKVDKKTIKPNLDTIKNTYKLKSLELGEKGKYWGIHGEINPKDDKTTKAEIPDGEDGLVPSQEEVTRVLGTQFPDLANIINQLINDKKHPLGLVRDIVDASRRQRTLALIKEMAEKKILGDQSFEQFLQRNPGAGLLFEKVPDRVNFDEQGRSRKKSFVEDQKQLDPARAVGADLTKEQENQVKDYARRLSQEVEPKVREEVETLANNIKQKLGGEVVVSVRTKGAAGLIDKVQRMVNGAKGRNVRSDYQIGDVIDAVGARITVDNTKQLTALLQEIRGQLGDRILEIENMYASPKSHAPAYRVIPMVLKTEINGKFYTFELQLNTMRASIAADLEHNTIFKPLVQVTEEQKQMIKRIMEEAAALDQLETKKV